MNSLTTWLVSGGAATLILGLIGAVSSRSKGRADAAKVITETAAILIAEVRADNKIVEDQLKGIRVALLALIDAVETQTDALESGVDPRSVAARLKADLRLAREAV